MQIRRTYPDVKPDEAGCPFQSCTVNISHWRKVIPEILPPSLHRRNLFAFESSRKVLCRGIFKDDGVIKLAVSGSLSEPSQLQRREEFDLSGFALELCELVRLRRFLASGKRKKYSGVRSLDE